MYLAGRYALNDANDKHFKSYIGQVYHCLDSGEVEFIEDANIIVSCEGKIVEIGKTDDLPVLKDKYGLDIRDIQFLPKGKFFMPGMIDCHNHCSQISNCGRALDLPLLEWLNRYTYPVEAKFSDPVVARNVYRHSVNAGLRHGITAAAYFTTTHIEGTLDLCDIIDDYLQRGFIGKVCQDINCPDDYKETTAEAIEETKSFIDIVKAREYELVTPVITPRFTLNCSRELLDGLGRLAAEYKVPIQTHLNEAKEEIEAVMAQRPDCNNYLDTYTKSGLVNERTILAHCVHNKEEETDYIKAVGASVVHCPTSNLSLRSGIMDARHYLDKGIKMGLGTDVSGGFSVSIMHAMRMAIINSKVCAFSRPPGYKVLTYKEVFYLATLGGCRVLGIDKIAGNFQVGKEWDALVVNTYADDTPMAVYQFDSPDDLLEKFVYQADDRNIEKVYVGGKKAIDHIRY